MTYDRSLDGTYAGTLADFEPEPPYYQTPDGKDVQVYLFAKNGRHYSMPKPPDDPLVEYLMSDFGMKVSAARLLARRVPKGTEEERILAVHRMYDREGKA